MKIVYIIHWLAKEVGGDFVSSMVEFGTLDKSEAETYFIMKQQQEQVMNIDGHMCDIRRMIVPIEIKEQGDV